MTSVQTAPDPAPTSTPPPVPASSGLVDATLARLRQTPVWVVLIQTFIGLGWLRAATEKVIDGAWWSGEVIESYLAEHADTRLPWFDTFAELFVEPNLAVVLVGVVALQAAIGLALVSGIGRRVALVAGMGLNLVFVAGGAVNPSVFYLLAQMAVFLWMLEHRWDRNSEVLAYLTMGVGWFVAMVSLPFMRTIDPMAVIDDPAVMLATFGGLVSGCAFLLIDRMRFPTEESLPGRRMGLRSGRAQSGNVR